MQQQQQQQQLCQRPTLSDVKASKKGEEIPFNTNHHDPTTPRRNHHQLTTMHHDDDYDAPLKIPIIKNE
ncbi:hypothetical protein M0804_006660 [Polistes exclamans]|nr:hypothetical protein M0804_006660 [Polistes exclamans]